MAVVPNSPIWLTGDPEADAFWLVREYLPQFAEVDRRQFPPMSAYEKAFGVKTNVDIETVPGAGTCIRACLPVRVGDARS